MLREFLVANRSELIERCRGKVSRRRAPRATPAELEHGVPLFLSQLTAMLPSRVSGASETGSAAAEAQIATTAAQHGHELLEHGFTIEQVVHDYGDLCQSITELAVEKQAPISTSDFGLLNIRLDDAIAGAVSEYTRKHDVAKADKSELATSERLGLLASEMRGLLNTTIIAISAIRSGSVGFGGATGSALDRTLIAMRGLIDRTLADVRLREPTGTVPEVIEMAAFVAELRVAATLEASEMDSELAIAPVASGIFVLADRHLLAAALANLLHEAFRGVRGGSHVALSVRVAGGRVLIDVEDQRGELSQVQADRLCSVDHALSRKSVEASGGKLTARIAKGRGCVFTIDLPAAAPPKPGA